MRRVIVGKSVVFVVMSLALQSACGGATKPPNVTPDPTPADLRYLLPKTTIALDLQVERSSQSPGRYCDFLDLFFPELDLGAACQSKDGKTAPDPGTSLIAAKTRTSIHGYSVALKGTADSTREHFVKFDSSWNIERADSFSLSESGILTGADVTRTDHTAEIVIGVLSNIAKIAGRFVFGGGDAADVKAPPPGAAPWEVISALKANFGLMTSARQAAYRKLWTDPAGKARLTLATRSYQLLVEDTSKLATVFDNAAVGSPVVVPELRKQIADRLTTDFLGSKSKDLWTPTYEVTPELLDERGTSASFTLFTFAGCGVIDQTIVPVKTPLTLKCSDATGV